MTSLSKQQFVAVVAVLVLALGAMTLFAAERQFYQTFTLDAAWPQPTVTVFCDGPHRVYVGRTNNSEGGLSVAVLANGCVGWPKVPAEAR